MGAAARPGYVGDWVMNKLTAGIAETTSQAFFDSIDLERTSSLRVAWAGHTVNAG
jgi:hypothetical protein